MWRPPRRGRFHPEGQGEENLGSADPSSGILHDEPESRTMDSESGPARNEESGGRPGPDEEPGPGLAAAPASPWSEAAADPDSAPMRADWGEMLVPIGGMPAPRAPETLEETGVDPSVLGDLALKLAFTTPSFTTRGAADDLCLPQGIVEDLLAQLKTNRLIEVLGDAGTQGYRWAISGIGRDRAARLIEISGYVGPAPVSVETYARVLEAQFEHLPEVTPDQVRVALADLTLADQAIEVAGLAASSRRPLFLYGPPGNGKTSIGHLIHDAVEGHIWVPHCLGVDSNVVRIFDSQVHIPDPLDVPPQLRGQIDRRWVRVRRPFVVVGGELTLDALDLAYSPTLRYYEAPFHLKANGGTFLLDDFGFQRVDPNQILARWVFPLENGSDHLTLQTGQKMRVPFRQMLIISTNMDPEKVMDPAFLRRIGYRLYVGDPSPEEYTRIFGTLASKLGVEVTPALMAHILERYREERRPLRGCEPRDLLRRTQDICRFQNRPFGLDTKTLDLAWRGYFGEHVGGVLAQRKHDTR